MFFLRLRNYVSLLLSLRTHSNASRCYYVSMWLKINRYNIFVYNSL